MRTWQILFPFPLPFYGLAKRFHDDFRDLVFVKNTFLMDMLNPQLLAAPDGAGGVGRQPCLRDSFTHRLQKIHIDYNPFHLKSDYPSIKILKRWGLNGNIRSVTLATQDTTMWRNDTVNIVIQTSKLLGGVFQRVALKMVLTLGTAVTVKALTTEPSAGSERVHFDDLIRNWHQNLGGKFWIGDTLCWKDGIQVNQIPQLG
jgi:hypothetical protein